MLLFQKLVDETQISTPPEDTRYHNSRKYWSFYPSEPFRMLNFNMRYPVPTSEPVILRRKSIVHYKELKIEWTKCQVFLKFKGNKEKKSERQKMPIFQISSWNKIFDEKGHEASRAENLARLGLITTWSFKINHRKYSMPWWPIDMKCSKFYKHFC